MNRSNLQDKTCAVIGLARAGAPAARFLVEQGATVLGYDGKTLGELSDEARALREIGVELRLGEHGFEGIEKCDLVVLSPGLKVHHEPLQSVIARCEAAGAEVIGELELASRFCPAPIIAVTGTKGKSTTVKLINELLQAAGKYALRAGNTGIPLIAELPRLSPDSYAVVEVSSFQLERAPTFKPRVAVLLNLLEDHQDYHPDLQQYWATKLKLFANQTADDVAIFNCDDAGVCGLLQGEGALAEIVAGLKARRKVVAAESDAVSDDAMPLVAAVRDGALGWLSGNAFVPVIAVEEIPLRGSHNLANAAAALAAVRAVLAKAATSQQTVLADAIRKFESLPHRLEIVARKHGITWVNDSQATIPEAAVRALEAFAPPVTLIAGGKAKLGAASYEVLGAAIARRAHCLLTIGEAAAMVAQAARNAGFSNQKIIHAETLTTAVETAKILTPDGGIVLLSPACASFDQFSSFEARGAAFREAVAALHD
jgi:UDP-N-acetylmuramoylalanine--D-glutamate ligase